jgi:phosphotransferase system enzyme I (PtsI)
MGGEVTFTALLIGLGVDELSAAPPLIPQIKFLLRRLKMTEAKELADFALGCESTTEILARAQELARNIAPSLFENKL